MWNVGGRLSFLLTPRILLYGTGGYSRANLDGGVTIDFTQGNPLTIDAPDKLDGYFVGGGGEFKLHRNVSLKFEYHYAKYDGEGGSISQTWESHPVCLLSCRHQYKLVKESAANANFDLDIQSVRRVLVLKLDHPDPPVTALK